MSNKDLQRKRKLTKAPAAKPVSLRPLKVEEALADLLKVKPPSNPSKIRDKRE